MLSIDTSSGLSGKNNGDYLFTLPTGFIPSRDIAYATLNSSSRNVEVASVPLLIKNNGEVSIFATPAPLGPDVYYALISYTI